jgi:hypothetical protein
VELLFFVAVLLMLDVLSLRFGFDSRALRLRDR